METTNKHTGRLASFVLNKINDYKLLVKFNLSLLVVFSSFITYILGASVIEIQTLSLLVLGGFLITGAANALNQVLEKEFDKLMNRTMNRPLASGRMEISEAVLSAGLMSVVGLVMLASINAQTAFLGALSLLIYAFIYTPLKRVTPASVWIGAIPGALPMSIGWLAAGGNLFGPEVIVLFAIQFLWQFPHFWAIAWLSYEDYSRAGFYLLPSSKKDGRDKSTALQTMFYAFCLIPLSILPYYFELSGHYALIVMLAMGVFYTYKAYQLYRNCDEISARKLMFASFIYLPVVLLILIIDKI